MESARDLYLLKDTIVSIFYFLCNNRTSLYPLWGDMTPFLIDDTDVQQAFAAHLRRLRRQAKLSRDALAERSGVPASTIKKFELTGQISFRQLLLLWQSLDDLRRLYALTRHFSDQAEMPSSIDEVLSDDL